MKTFISVMAAAVVNNKYIYAMNDEATGQLTNVVDHLCEEMRIHDREGFRETLSCLNQIEGRVASVMTQTTYDQMIGLLSNYHTLSKNIIVYAKDTNAEHGYTAKLITQTRDSITNEKNEVTIQLKPSSSIPFGREYLSHLFAEDVTFISFGGKSIYDAIDPDELIISEYTIPAGQQERFINNGVCVKPLRKFRHGETVTRCDYGNWHCRKMFLSDID